MSSSVTQSYTIPYLHNPIAPALSPCAEAVQEHTNNWAKQHRLIQGEIAEKRFRAGMFGRLAARVYPKAAFEDIALASDWITALFMLDDHCDEAGIGKQPDKLRTVFDELLTLLHAPQISEDASPKVQESPLTAATSELWQRIRVRANPAWEKRFVASVADYFDGCIWEAKNRAQNITPSVSDYIKWRPLTGAVFTFINLIDITEHISLPDSILERDDIRQLALMSNKIICWYNDVVSLHKEIQRNDVHNLVLVIQHEHQLSLQHAVNRAAEMHNDEVEAFLALQSTIPSFGAEINEQLAKYIGVLNSWPRGNVDWSTESGRYRPVNAVPSGESTAYLEPIIPA
jgi:hypothetical protein